MHYGTKSSSWIFLVLVVASIKFDIVAAIYVEKIIHVQWALPTRELFDQVLKEK